RVTEAAVLHVIVSDLEHELRAHGFPRQILALTPAALAAGHSTFDHALGPVFPGMMLERILPIRRQKFDQLETSLVGEARAHAYVLQRARVVEQSEQERADTV